MDGHHNPRDDQLSHSPTGCVRVGTDSGRRLLRPDGQPVAPTPGCQEAVKVNVYDLHWTNRVTKRIRLAAYHTGIELHGIEIAYGDSGVYTMTPRDVDSMEARMAFKKSVHLGFTYYNREDALLICRWLGRCEFTAAMYDLLRRNCNHFSAAIGRLLCPHGEFPAWINSLATVGTRLPFVERRIRRFIDAENYVDDGDTDAHYGDACAGGDAAECDGDDKSSSGEKKRRGLREICANLSRASCAASGGQRGKGKVCED